MYEDIQKDEEIKGVKFWQNERNNFHVLMLHYTADPEKDPEREGKEWFEKERRSSPKAVWQKEYEIDFTTKAGLLVFGSEFCDFSPKKHLINSFELGDDVELFMAMDFGQRNPNAALVGAVNGRGQVFIIDEYFNPAIPSVASREMFEKFGYLMPGYDKALTIREKQLLANNTFFEKVIDPSTGHKNRTKIIEGEEIVYSVIEDFDDNGWDFGRAHNDWEAGITRVREYFSIDGSGDSNLYIFADKCPNLVWELQHYRYQEHSEQNSRKQNSSEKPMKKDDHAMDALRYLMMTRPQVPQQLEKKLTLLQKDVQRLMKPKIYNSFDVD